MSHTNDLAALGSCVRSSIATHTMLSLLIFDGWPFKTILIIETLISELVPMFLVPLVNG